MNKLEKTVGIISGLSALFFIYQLESHRLYINGYNKGNDDGIKWEAEIKGIEECAGSGFKTARYDEKKGCLIDRMEAECQAVLGTFKTKRNENYKECLKNLTVSDFENKTIMKIVNNMGKKENELGSIRELEFIQRELQYKRSNIKCDEEKCTYKNLGYSGR